MGWGGLGPGSSLLSKFHVFTISAFPVFSVTLVDGHFSVPMTRSPGVNTRRRKEPFELLLYSGLFIMAGRHKGSALLASKEVNNIHGPVPSTYFLQLDSTSQRSYSLQKSISVISWPNWSPWGTFHFWSTLYLELLTEIPVTGFGGQLLFRCL